MNSVHLVGRLVQDPVLKKSAAGDTVYCNFAMAIERPKPKEANAQSVDFPRITAFGKLAENLCSYTEKGNYVSVQASIRTSSYEKGGQKQYSSEIVANRIQFLQWKTPEKEA